MNCALVIIDMQQGSFTDSSPRHDSEGLITRLNALANAVRVAGGVVIFVQHDGQVGDLHHPDLPGWKLLPGLHLRTDDMIVRKASCDAFLGTPLKGLLKERGIERLIITGCATD
jgi:nicotinamidase-related amidase